MHQVLAIGIDIGGTFIKSALVSKTGEVLKRGHVPTQAQENSSKVIANIFSIINDLTRDNKNIAGIGIGVPGNVQLKTGLIKGCYNVPALDGFPLLETIKKEFSYQVFVDNDATNAAKGEFLFGAGKTENHLIALTLGTGIGGGIILNRKVFHGITNYAGEIGHMTLYPEGMLCRCGKQGCFEAYASATAIIDFARQAKKREYSSELLSIPDKKLSAEIVCNLANEGDIVCKQIIKRVGSYIAFGVANVINLLNIPLVVIGGGVSQGGKILFQAINEHVEQLVLPPLKETYRVVQAQLGNDAGVIGSASSVFMEGNTSY